MSSNGAPSGNVALLIDADNASAAHFDPVLTVLAELGTVNIRRAYGNWSKPALKKWATLSITQAIEPQQQFDLTKGKNATDMKMTIDAMDLLFSGRVQGFGLMSSDSDFTPLVTRIRQDGVPVYGFGTATTPQGFRQACTRFIDVFALGGTQKAVAVTGAGEIGEAIPTTEDMAATPAPATLPLDADLIKLLVDAYDSAKRDERGFALLGTVGQLAGNRSSFDARNYGYKRLSDLIEAVPNFITERREGGQLYVKRVR
jgi:uncharacterized protein (TIGR00288 family)